MNKRTSGILLHITSLPSRFGIGDLGPGAYRFADFLAEAGQGIWQILPVNPTSQGTGNSPYSSISAFAGNPLFISPELLAGEGLLTEDEIRLAPDFPAHQCDYARVIPYKADLLARAFCRAKDSGKLDGEYRDFCASNGDWLDNHALFTVIKGHHKEKPWYEWAKKFRDRKGKSLETVGKKHKDEIEKEKFLQYVFFRQWQALKKYCNEKGIRFLGDLPIYVSYDSADVWANRDLFRVDEEGHPTHVAGVPPDYFSPTGQLWGNPLYRWDVMKDNGFRWWQSRMGQNLKYLDMVRVDHFRGLVAYWEVPAGEETAVNGQWVNAPVRAFLDALLKSFPGMPIVAEDLGIITDDVKEVLKDYGFPGMKVLQFAFGEDNPTHPYLPHMYDHNWVVYTGTHDNNTTRGWFENETSPDDKARIFRYFGRELYADTVHWDFIRMAMMSVANTAVFPLQDALGLGSGDRMNKPSVAFGNWQWRVQDHQLVPSVAGILRGMTHIYGRELK
ncbi:MAG: 4-alpha-glucanotransferase [Candidatus Omnitrophota bacterium]